jgi:hypothetical protein
LTTAHQNRPQEREFGDARFSEEGRKKVSDCGDLQSARLFYETGLVRGLT